MKSEPMQTYFWLFVVADSIEFEVEGVDITALPTIVYR